VRSRINAKQFLEICHYELSDFKEEEAERENILLTQEQQDSLEGIEDAYEAVQNPLLRLEHFLHPISAFIVMPIFALANAGVQISGISFPLVEPASLGILLGLVLGKPLGIFGATYLAQRLGWAQIPPSLSWKHVIGASILGGVGFTMSIFITHLAFEDANMIALAKLFILICSMFMGIAGVLYLWRISSKKQRQLD
jgi:NhaA family Na+:H+ antiporter